MMVMGGNQKAQQCFMNAELAAQSRASIGNSLLEPCDYSLEYGSLSFRDRSATFANRGIVHAALGKFDEAMKDYDDAMAIRPGAPENYINRGNAFFLQREYANALDDYEKSLRLGLKQQQAAHYNMGLTFERLGDDVAAEREYLRARDLDEDWALPVSRLEIVRERLQSGE